MTEIFIENNRADGGDISSLLTFAIDDIKDFASRNCTFSKTIVLPGTSRNNKIFGHIFNAQVSNPYDAAQDNVLTNFNAAVAADCIMFQDNIQVFKGIIRLMEIVITSGVPEYEVSVFGELGGFILELGNKKLTDLDFSEYDHILSTTNITNSWDNVSGYFYPVMDVGGVSINKVDYDITAFRPALFAWEYIYKIFGDTNYRYEAPLFTTPRFLSLVIPYNLKTLRSAETVLMTATRTTRYKVVDNLTGDQNEDLKFETFTGTGWSANVDKNEFTYTDSPQLQATIFFSILGDYEIDTNTKTINLNIQKNATSIPGYAKILSGHSGSSSTPYVWQFSFDITLNQNDIIKFNYLGQLDVVNVDAFATNCIFQVTSAVPVYAPAGIGDDIEMSQVIPQNILQKDFLSSIIKLFNLYLYENSDNKKILIKPYVDFYDTTLAGVIDWTYKMDRNKSVRLKPMSELNSRYYNFKMKADNDYYNEIYRKRYNESFGDRIYDSEFEFTNEKTDVELIFSPSVLVGYAGVDKIVTATYKLNAGVEEKTDINIRILQTKKVTGVGSWSIKDQFTTLVSGLTDYGYAGNYDDPDAPANDIHFGVPRELFFTLATGAINVTQFNVYWSSYMAEITDKDSKMMTAFFKLTNADIFNLDFSKPIHVDGSIWRLNKIEDFNASDPDVCKVELIKIINLFY